MNIWTRSGKLRKDKSSRYFHAESAMVAAEDAAAAYQAPSMLANGAQPQHILLLSALLDLPVAFLFLKVPSIMKRIGSRKKAVVFLAFLDSLTWLPLVGAMFFIGPVSPAWLIALWLFNLVPGVLLLPARDSWLADSMPANRLGRHLGIRTAVSATLYIGMFFVTGYMMDVFSSKLFTGFGLVFLIALIATTTKVLIYSRIHDVIPAVEHQTEFSLRDFVRETKDQGLGRFILYVSLFNFTVFLCSPLFAVYMINELNFSYTTFALVFSADFVARVLSGPFWGRYADRIGSLPVVRIVSYLIPFIPILWLLSSNVVYLVCVQLFSGILWAGFDIGSHSLIYKSASQEDRAGYIIYKRSLVALFQALGALAGAGLLTLMIPVLGSKILGLFLFSGILRLVIAEVMLPRIRDIADASSALTNTFSGSFSDIFARKENPGAAVKDGLYYKSDAWAKYLNKTKPQENPSIDTGKPVSLNPGLYYRPQAWGYYIKFTSPEAVNKKKDVNSIEPGQGLFYRIPDWANFIRQSPPEPTPAEKREREIDEARKRLAIWQRYNSLKNQTQPETIIGGQLSAVC